MRETANRDCATGAKRGISQFGHVAAANEISRNARVIPQLGANLAGEAEPRVRSAAKRVYTSRCLEGRILAGRYRLISQLGRGGMGSVWRAEHLDLGTPAAVKLIDETYVQSPEALTRFRREAQAAASLRSANVVQILDYGLDGETPYIAMELLEGESLADRMERQYKLEPIDCATILLQVSKALAKAHDMGIVHRDLKPDNIFLVRDGEDEIAKVLDFGIAKQTSATQLSGDMATRTGSLMGTPYYMSPEQASGRRQVDQRTDIWAYAVIAFECMTGQRPFDDNNLGGLLLSICTEFPRRPSSVASVPLGFDEWFARCTAKDPAGRFASIREAAGDLCRICGVQIPASRLGSLVQMEGGPQVAEQTAVQSVTSPWQGGVGRQSVATPGAVAKSIVSDEEQRRHAETILRGKPQRSKLLVLSGAIAGLGVLSAVTAASFRYVGSGSAVSANAVPAVETVAAAAVPAPSIAPPAVTIAPPSTLPAMATSAQSAALTTEALSGAVAAKAQAPATKLPGTAKTPAPAKVVAPVRAPVHTSDPPRLRPQDRLERDLGF